MPRQKTPFPAHARRVFQGLRHDVWQWEQELYDGTTAIFEAVKRVDTAALVGVLPDKRILLVEDEQPDRPAVITTAGGQVEAGESPQQAAEREFTEETGYTASAVKLWYRFQPPGRVYFTVHMFVGRITEPQQPPQPEAGERIRLLTYSFDEFVALGNEPRLRDLYLRVLLLQAQLNADKRQELRRLLYG